MEHWWPPWRLEQDSAWAVVVASTDRGIGVRVDTREIPVTRISPWAAAWLSRYAVQSPNLASHDETTFIYILGTPSLGEPDGVVRRTTGVIEFGLGTGPSGPPNGREIPATTLINAALSLLR